MLLAAVHIPGKKGLQDIRIDGEKITGLESHETSSGIFREKSLRFENAIAFPGLINSHDHLDFNLFPRLGNRKYKSYREWGADIHLQNKAVIDQVLKVPKLLRTQWGIYKNLLNGVTTVLQHGEKLEITTDLLSVEQSAKALHSLAGEKRWKFKLISPVGVGKPVVIHTGEGTDTLSSLEIDRLTHWNIFGRKLIGIHGVAMDPGQARHFKALVWCPDSNFFLLNKTAPVRELKKITTILFGTDSTLTASWNIWEQMRLARSQQLLSDEELFRAVSTRAAEVWKLDGSGEIGKGRQADIVVAKVDPADHGWDSFYGVNPEDILLVLRKGKINLFDASLQQQLSSTISTQEFHQVCVGNNRKFVNGNLPALMKEIARYHPSFQFPISCSMPRRHNRPADEWSQS